MGTIQKALTDIAGATAAGIIGTKKILEKKKLGDLPSPEEEIEEPESRTPLKQEQTQVEKIAKMRERAEDSLEAAKLQREDKIFDDEARLRQRLREMKARYLTQKEVK